MTYRIGTLQGRLTPSHGRGIQFFPSAPGEWEREFEVARDIGIAHLEWVWDKLENPLMQPEIAAQVWDKIAMTGVPVRNVDVQVLTTFDIAGCSDAFIENVCRAMGEVDAGGLDVPLLEKSSLIPQETRAARLSVLKHFVSVAQQHNLRVNLETDLPPSEYKKVLNDLPDINIVYDSGNSSSLGYNIAEEWDAYAPRIVNVQIKDRPKGGTTVPLGTGGTDFATLFKKMKEAGYTGLVTLQAARGEDGHEAETVKSYIEFVHNHE